MSIACTICARGGSKGVPGKNLAMIAGKPLIAHSIDQARRAALFDVIGVSSDSAAILAAAEAAGADEQIERPARMATDTAGKAEAILHALQTLEARAGRRFEILVDLAVTSPLRLPEDIIGAVGLLRESGAASVITGSPARCPPYFSLVECDTAGVARLSKPLPHAVVRRQDAPPCFDMNGSIYVWNTARFRADPRVFYPDTRLFVMPEERSIDIDTPLDLRIARMLMSEPSGAL